MEINYKKSQPKFTPVTLTVTFTTPAEWEAWKILLVGRTALTAHWDSPCEIKDAMDTMLARLYMDMIQTNLG